MRGDDVKRAEFSEVGQRLRIGAEDPVALIGAPPEYARIIPGVDGSIPERADVVIGFARQSGDLELLGGLYDAALAGSRAWLAYPKPRQSEAGPRLTRDWLARDVRRYGVHSMVHASIDQAWSALLVEPIEALDDESPLEELDLAWPGS